MGKITSIAWTNHTFNLSWGCTKVSPACENCYAEALARRFGFNVWGLKAERRTFGDRHWREPLRWNAVAQRAGQRHRVFCSSMADVFEDHPTITQEREKLWPLIRSTPALDWQLLTKRADRIKGCLPSDWGSGYPNVWVGVTIENQEWAAKRIPYLLKVKAAVRFLSAEPLLGSIDLSLLDADPYSLDADPERRIDWVIVGGESGPHHRALNIADARQLRDQCRSRGIAFFFKQVGGLRPDSGGHRLDGHAYQELPTPRALG